MGLMLFVGLMGLVAFVGLVAFLGLMTVVSNGGVGGPEKDHAAQECRSHGPLEHRPVLFRGRNGWPGTCRGPNLGRDDTPYNAFLRGFFTQLPNGTGPSSHVRAVSHM